ncbi:MAG: amidohydrolase family protein, partial [Candidatus ainarchaeum sp.]|nr:amidohydrolase family protein [Candidatus ainarchaeum sp.]
MNAPDSVLMPAMADRHTHPVLYSLLLDAMNPIHIFGKSSKKEVLEAISEGYSSRKGQKIIVVLGLDTNTIKDLTKEDLDKICPDIPLVVFDPSFHGGVVNSKALDSITSTAKSKSGTPIAGAINQNGQLTEEYLMLSFTLMDLSFGSSREEISERMSEVILTWINQRVREGVAQIDDLFLYTAVETLSLIKAAEKWEKEQSAPFPVRKIYLRPSVLRELLNKPETNADLIRKLQSWIADGKVGLKLLADGSIGSYTALVSQPYSNGLRGTIFDSLPSSTEAIKLANRLGITDVRMHAIGDNAILMAIVTLDLARKIIGSGARVGIEHFQLSKDRQILELTRELGATVCMQPNFSEDVYNYEERLGVDRVQRINPLATILELGIPMTFGTDGMPQSMLAAVMAATHHPVEVERPSLSTAIRVASQNNLE